MQNNFSNFQVISNEGVILLPTPPTVLRQMVVGGAVKSKKKNIFFFLFLNINPFHWFETYLCESWSKTVSKTREQNWKYFYSKAIFVGKFQFIYRANFMKLSEILQNREGWQSELPKKHFILYNVISRTEFENKSIKRLTVKCPIHPFS